MTLPSLPKDNLYKFHFIGGIVMTVTAIILSHNLYQENTLKQDAVLQQRQIITEYEMDSIRTSDLLEVQKMRQEQENSQFKRDSANLDSTNKDSVKAY